VPTDTPPASAMNDLNAGLYRAFVQSLAVRPEHTSTAYQRDVLALLSLAASTPAPTLTRAEISRFLATLHGGGLSGRSLARMLSAWRAFFRFLIERDRTMQDDPTAGLKAPKSPRRLPSALTPDEAVRLVTIEGDDILAIRDRALFELAYSSGLRLSELAQLDVDGVDAARGEVLVWGKGAKERVVPVGVPALAAIGAWLVKRQPIAARDEQALFVGARGRRLSPRSIERRLATWAKRRGLTRHVHPHMLRHSFASHVLQSSGDLRAVQEMLGHASIASTQVYTHLDFQALAKVYDAAHPRARRKRTK
jgi:integrase/recombinase XerC